MTSGSDTSAPIRILQALSTGDLGGTELMILRLAPRLDRRRFLTEVSVLDGHGPVTSRLLEEGVPVHDLSAGRSLTGAAARFRRLLRDRKYDLVHLYGFRMGFIGRFVTRLSRPRCTVVQGIRGLHVTESSEPTTLKTRFAVEVERLTAGAVDAYLANSHDAVDFLASRGLPRQKFMVIPNGIESPITTEQEAGPSPPAVNPTIVCVANFRPRKRQEDLVEALALLRERGLAPTCRFVGDGFTRPEVERLVRTKGLKSQVELTGHLSPLLVGRALSEASIFVLPSLWEGAPVSVLEAMAASLPIIATDVPGTRELVVHGVTGRLEPARNPLRLAGAIEELLENPALRQSMGQAGRARVARDFSLTEMTERHETAYRELVQANALSKGHHDPKTAGSSALRAG